jgi:hypothetical protein
MAVAGLLGTSDSTTLRTKKPTMMENSFAR